MAMRVNWSAWNSQDRNNRLIMHADKGQWQMFRVQVGVAKGVVCLVGGSATLCSCRLYNKVFLTLNVNHNDPFGT